MAHFTSSMTWQGGQRWLIRLSRQEGSLVLSTAPAPPPPQGSVVVLTCHDNHQKVKGFLLRRDSWGFVLYLMRSGSTVHIVAMWCILTSGVNAPRVCLFGFPADFQFFVPSFYTSFLFSFFFTFPFFRHCYF